MEYDRRGVELCARFAFPPNRLHYCGPEKQTDLAGYITHSVADQGLVEILQKFETLYPYLKLIASANNIKDPFDTRVVKAYWIGNNFLDAVTPRAFHLHLKDNKKTKNMADMFAMGFPYHTFHVVNMYAMYSDLGDTVDQCRIRAGKIVTSGTVIVGGTTIAVSSIASYEAGDMVAIHWGHICTKLSQTDVKNLDFYTKKSFAYAKNILGR